MSFKNAMVILTSNVGSRTIASAAASGSGLAAFGSRRPGEATAEEEEEEDERAMAADRVRGAGGWGWVGCAHIGWWSG